MNIRSIALKFVVWSSSVWSKDLPSLRLLAFLDRYVRLFKNCSFGSMFLWVNGWPRGGRIWSLLFRWFGVEVNCVSTWLSLLLCVSSFSLSLSFCLEGSSEWLLPGSRSTLLLSLLSCSDSSLWLDWHFFGWFTWLTHKVSQLLLLSCLFWFWWSNRRSFLTYFLHRNCFFRF